MGRIPLGLVLIVAGISWCGAYAFYSRTTPDGSRVDLLGLSHPREVFSYQARRNAFHPRHGERFGYARFYLYWAGLTVPVGIGVKLIQEGRRRRTYYPKDYGRYGH